MFNKLLNLDFSSGEIELRFDDGEICIYATNIGLEKIISFCEKLKEKNGKNHIHLEDYAVLTKKSLKGVFAKFEDD